MKPLVKQSTQAIALFCGAVLASPAFAQTNSAGMMDNIEGRFKTAAAGWATILTGYATNLFIALAAISLVVTFGIMAVRKAELGELFAEFVRYMLFTGFFLWLLRNGPAIGSAIITSMQQMGQNAGGGGAAVTPGSIVDIGFDILNRMLTQSSFWQPVDSAIGILCSIIILIVLGLVAINMLLLLISAWIMAFGGVFFLGFGGSRWTSDFAINYFKVLLGVAGSLFGMILIVGIGKSFLDQFYAEMNGAISIKDLAVMLVACVILLVLVNKIPQLISGILTGASVGAGALVGNAGAGTAFAAGSLAGAALATGGAALAAGAANAAGAGSAVFEAARAASSSIASGSSSSSSSGSSGGNGSSGGGFGGVSSGGGDSSTGNTPLAQASGGGGSSGGGGGGGGGGFRPGSSTVGNLARATGSAAFDAIRARVAATPGGQIAERIRAGSAANQAPQFTGDTIGGGPSAADNAPSRPANDEVDSFVNKRA